MNAVLKHLNWNRPGRRFLGLAVLLLTLVSLFLPGNARAVLQRMGPINNASTVGGFPAWFQDTTGLTMEFCDLTNLAELQGGWCTLIPPNPPGVPEVFPTNFFIEHFYHDATNVLTDPVTGTRVRFIAAVEASFTNGAVVVPGQQMTFGRLRVHIPSLPFSGTYTVYHPYGKWVFPNRVAGDRLFFTEDVGLGCPGTFTCTLGTSIGPYLLPSPTPGGPEVPPIPNLLAGQDPYYDILAPKTAYPGTGKLYIADPKRIGPITGSPLPPFVGSDGLTHDHNTLRVEGPNGFVVDGPTNWTLTGRIMSGALPGQATINRASYASTATGFKIDVFATGSPAVQSRVPATAVTPPTTPLLTFYEAACGGAIDPLTLAILPPPYTAPVAPVHPMANAGPNYWGQATPLALPNPLYVCVEDASATNALGQVVPNFILQALTDDVFIDTVTAPAAFFDGPGGGNLTVKGFSTDATVPGPVLLLAGFGVGGTGLPLVAGTATVTGLAAPPATVQVVSSAGGVAILPVITTVGATVVAGVPVAVNDTLTMFEDCSPTPATACAVPPVINVLANDTYNGAAIPAGSTVTITQAPRLGTAVVNLDNTITYTPLSNVNGTDVIAYTVTVAGVASNVATLTITITPVPDYPIAVNDVTGAVRGIANTVNVLANDTSPDGFAALTGAVIVTGNPNLGIVAGTVYPGGVITYTPPASVPTGPQTFTYNAMGSGLLSLAPATVTVNIAAAEVIVPISAIYTQKTGRWTVKATVTPAAGQTFNITLANGTYKVAGACTGAAAGSFIGSVAADALGNILYDVIIGANVAGVTNPSNTGGNSTGFWCTPPSAVTITDSRGAAVATANVAIQLK